MKTLNRINPIRNTLNRLALAVAVAAGLAAGTALAAPPANDNFAAAIDLTGATGTQTGTNNSEATLEVGEPNPGTGATNTVWFKWTCAAHGNLTVSTKDSTAAPGPGGWDAVLGIYSGSAVNALTPLGTTPLDTGTEETMTVAVTAGTTYSIQLAGYANAVAANIVLNWNFALHQADMLTFGPGATISPVVLNAATIAWTVPNGSVLQTLTPTFTLSPGATCVAGAPPVSINSGDPVDFSGGPVVFTVTAQGASPIINHYTVTVTVRPPFVPPTPPPVTSGMKVWVSGDGVNIDDPGQTRVAGADTFVKQWNDLSGNSNNATQTTAGDQPKYIASGAGGKPVVRFNGGSSKMTLADLSSSFPSAASVFAVITPNNDNMYSAFGNRNNDERWVGGNWSEVTPGAFREGRANFSGSYSLMPQTGSHVFAYQSGSSAYNFLLNGNLIGTAAANYNSGSGRGWTIGTNGSGNGAELNGDIAELILYDRVLTPAEADQVGAYLEQKYGLNTNYGPNAKMLTFGPGAAIGAVAANAAAITWSVPVGTDLATLKPTFTLSDGATCTVLGDVDPPVSGETRDFTDPVEYIVSSSDSATINHYTVTVTFLTPPPGGVTGLTLWLDASALTGLSDGNTMTAWPDGSGLGNNATAAGTPVYKTGVLNTQPVVRFNGSSSFTTANLSALFPSAATGFIVTTISNDDAYTLVKANPGVDEWWRYNGNGRSYPGFFRGNRLESYCEMPTTGSHLFAITSSASAWEMAIDGASKGVAGANYNSGGAPLIIGNGSSGGGLNGDIAEVLIYNRVLSAGEADQVGAYLATKYGLTTIYGPPTVLSYTPPDGGTTAATSDLVLTFNKPIAIGAGNITLKNLTNSTQTVIPIDDTQVSISGAVLTINPLDDLVLGKDYAVQIDAGAIKALSDAPFAGISNDTTWNFASAPPTATTIGVVSSVSPTTYGDSVTFTATVSPIPSGGTVQFYSGFDYLGTPVAVNTTTGEATVTTTTLGAGTHEITAEYSGNYQFTGSSTAASISQVVNQAPLTVKALKTFRAPNTANPVPFPYQITGYQNGQILGTSGVTGTPDLTTDADLESPVGDYDIICAIGTLVASNYSFTLENGILTITNLACQVGVLNLNANGGINPQTGVAWAAGDKYRLIFVTSADTACTSTDITTYNSFVQGLAAASTFPKLGSVTWKVVGSTASVAARDNTATNPGVNGVGEPILRMDGLFVIATNYADLWNGIIASHVPGGNYLAVHLNENGVEKLHERVRTGSDVNGTATGAVLGASPSVQTGRNHSPNHYGGYGAGGWMQDWAEAAASPGPVYAMSETLTIVSTGATPYDTWANGTFANPFTDKDPAHDPDGDGQTNQQEFAFGLDPTTGSSVNPISQQLNQTTGVFKYTRTKDSGLTYKVYYSTNLSAWTWDEFATQSPAAAVAGVETVTVTLAAAAPLDGRLFVRVEASPVP